MIVAGAAAHAETGSLPEFCHPLERPYVPADPAEVAKYRDLIIADFEEYMSGVTTYFSCLERERERATLEVREVGDAYRAFQEQITR